MSVREATVADFPRVLELVRQFQTTSVHGCMPFSEERAGGMVNACIHDPMMCAFVWEREPGLIAGLYMGRVGPWWHTEELAAFDIAFYIDPDHRGGWGARPLYRAFRDWARSKGAKTIWPGTSSGIDVERAAGFYLRQKLEKIGYVFFGRLDG